MLENVREAVKRWMDRINMETGEVTRVPVEVDHVGVDGLDEDISPHGREYYPIVGDDVVTAITELKQAAAYEATHDNTGVPTDAPKPVRVRVIEFKVGILTYTRTVAQADRLTMSRLKADIENRVRDTGMDVDASMRRIMPTLRVRPGFVYANI